MVARTLVVLLAGIVGLVSSFDPNSVPISTRDTWCQSQQAACPLLCLQMPNDNSPPAANTCNAKTLNFACVCNNGLSPNASQYSQTIPYYICTEENNQCVQACNGDSTCQTACRVDHPCGAQHPIRVNLTTVSHTTAAATSSMATNVVYTGFGTGVAATGTTHKALAPRQFALDLGPIYGLSFVVGGFAVGFFALL